MTILGFEHVGMTCSDLDRTIAAFDVQPRVAVADERTLVAIETAANIAIGGSPWGPDVSTRVREGDALGPVRGQLVLVGKNNHRHDWVRALVEEARGIHPDVIVVDMGWPGDSREYADVATFGASRHASQALNYWLEQQARHKGDAR